MFIFINTQLYAQYFSHIMHSQFISIIIQESKNPHRYTQMNLHNIKLLIVPVGYKHLLKMWDFQYMFPPSLYWPLQLNHCFTSVVCGFSSHKNYGNAAIHKGLYTRDQLSYIMCTYVVRKELTNTQKIILPTPHTRVCRQKHQQSIYVCRHDAHLACTCCWSLSCP